MQVHYFLFTLVVAGREVLLTAQPLAPSVIGHFEKKQGKAMRTGNSYVYFAFQGEDFDPSEVTSRIGIDPTDSWKKGDKGKYKQILQFSCWMLSTEEGKEYLLIDNLVDEIINKLYDKIELINELKMQFKLSSVLEIVLDIDFNPEQSTPALGHDLRTIEFLHRTKTITDVDIYRFNSANDNE